MTQTWLDDLEALGFPLVAAEIRRQQTAPRCPVCGMPMYQTRRGATLRKRGPAWLCPKDEAETWTDENGRRHRLSESQHKPARRVWEAHELSEGGAS